MSPGAQHRKRTVYGDAGTNGQLGRAGNSGMPTGVAGGGFGANMMSSESEMGTARAAGSPTDKAAQSQPLLSRIGRSFQQFSFMRKKHDIRRAKLKLKIDDDLPMH